MADNNELIRLLEDRIHHTEECCKTHLDNKTNIVSGQIKAGQKPSDAQELFFKQLAEYYNDMGQTAEIISKLHKDNI
jgi:hypothetical protein